MNKKMEMVIYLIIVGKSRGEIQDKRLNDCRHVMTSMILARGGGGHTHFEMIQLDFIFLLQFIFRPFLSPYQGLPWTHLTGA